MINDLVGFCNIYILLIVNEKNFKVMECRVSVMNEKFVDENMINESWKVFRGVYICKYVVC